MPELDVTNLGQFGIIRDVKPHLLPPNAWDEGQNIRMEENVVKKHKGHVTTFTGIPTISPIFLLPLTTATTQFWVYASANKLKVTEGSTEFDITRSSGGDYNADTTSSKWTGTVFGQVVVLNNPVDDPQQWNLSTGTPAQALSNWPPPHVTTMRAKWMRGWKNHLIAGNITEDGTEYSQLVRWSSVADPGTVPGSWDETDPTNEAGSNPLVETGGRIIDGYPNGQNFIIFKEDSLIRMTRVGGIFIFDFKTYSSEFGVFTRNCITPFKPGSVAALGYEDIVVTNGQSVESIIDARLKRWLFNQIDGDNLEMCWAARNEQDKEIWFGFPETGAAFPNKAVIWNYRENSWGVRDIPSVLHAANGVLDSTTSGAPTYDSQAVAYDGYGAPYGLQTYNPATRRFALAGSNSSKIFEAGQGSDFDGSDFTASIRRNQFPFFPGRNGEPVRDTAIQKLVTKVTPQLAGDVGTVVNIYVGQSQLPDASPSWAGPFPFTIGTTEFVTPFVSARIPGFRFESTGTGAWELGGYRVEMQNVGRGF